MAAFEGKYSYRPGFSFKVPAQVVGETLSKIAEDGEVTSQALLDASRDADAPTHGLFEWDDSVAANRYRLHQATCVINAVEVHIVTKSGNELSQAAFVNVCKKEPARTGSFVPIEVAMSDGEMRSKLMDNALCELKAFRRKYSRLSELSVDFGHLIEQIDYVVMMEEKFA